MSFEESGVRRTRSPQWQRIDPADRDKWNALIDRFQHDWGRQSLPDITRYWETASASPHFELVLEELLLVDIRFRAQHSLAQSLDQYMSSHPSIGAQIAAAYAKACSREKNLLSLETIDHLAQPPQIPASQLTQSASPWNPPEGDSKTRPKDNVAPMPTAIGRYVVLQLLGTGTFGCVYLAEDPLLNRKVAVKIAKSDRMPSRLDVQRYFDEARKAASLEHPHIARVYDVGETAEFPFFMVTHFVNGRDLAKAIRSKPAITWQQTAEMVAAVADALHYAHQNGLVHRDIKPANILLDGSNRPFVVDFGLAMKEADLGQGPEYVGTPAYMSPEQARGEGHRVDGRTDIFSLGVVLYELLVQRLPFRAETADALMEQIRNCEAKPVRQIDESIPKELERICLKALSKRLADRYTSAFDFADDLKAWLNTQKSSSTASPHVTTSVPPISAAQPVPPSQVVASTSDRRMDSDEGVCIVPRGLRSFDEYDADFFLKLLPGPRDREGLPNVIRFWKQRLDETAPEKTFPVGLIYGPSGCGKSSLVRAGVVSRLAPHVVSIYIECDSTNTESRLVAVLRREMEQLVSASVEGPSKIHEIQSSNLAELLQRIRCSQFKLGKRKILIVLDQFEQWLWAWSTSGSHQLIDALRHCDGANVQCLLLVRDDYWLSTTRFMQELEVPIVEGQNASLVDVFDMNHAKKVLTYIGQAYQCLPAREKEFSADQRTFLNKAIEGLAEEGKVICVRLTLLAEMLKSKPWVPKTLRDVGGIDGVGITFLAETFSSKHASREHRSYQEGARVVLKELLPDTGNNIKGRLRSYDELKQLATPVLKGLSFDRLLGILDKELKLITPIESVEGHSGYQLSHDFLVLAVRRWSELKQQETLRGRAELKLADRTKGWSLTKETRQLPTLIEWLQIANLTSASLRTESQTAMMRDARKLHLRRIAAAFFSFALVCLLLLISWFSVLEGNRKSSEAANIVQNILSCPLPNLSEWIYQAQTKSELTEPLLRSELNSLAPRRDAKSIELQTRVRLGLLPSDSKQVQSLVERLLIESPEYFEVIHKALLPYKDEVRDILSREPYVSDASVRPLNHLVAGMLFHTEKPTESQSFAEQSLPLLSTYDEPEINRWLDICESEGAAILSVVKSNIQHHHDNVEGLPKVDREKLPADIVLKQQASRFVPTSQLVEALVLLRFGQNDPELLFQSLMVLEPKLATLLAASLRREIDKFKPRVLEALHRLVPELSPNVELFIAMDPEVAQYQLTLQRLRAAATLLSWEVYSPVWQALRDPAEPRLASSFIDAFPTLGLPLEPIRAQFDLVDDSVRQTLIQAFGKVPFEQIPQSMRLDLAEQIARYHTMTPDSGVRSASRWTLQEWNKVELLPKVDEVADLGLSPSRNWYVTPTGLQMAVMRGPRTEVLGAALGEWSKQSPDESWQSRIHLPRDVAISIHEITVDQFRRCAEKYGEYFHVKREVKPDWASRTIDSPIGTLSYIEAAIFCRWLSEEEEIPDTEQCYPKAEDIKWGMTLPSDFLDRKGYRLPTRAEWEAACRCESLTPYHFGSVLSPTYNYGWFGSKSQWRSHPVGQLMPNRLGLFDMHGNACEWCANIFQPIPRIGVQDTNVDSIGPLTFQFGMMGVQKGGDFSSEHEKQRTAYQFQQTLDFSWPASGLRIVRTLHAPPVTCYLQSHSGARAVYSLQSQGAFEIGNVHGPVQLKRVGEGTIEVTPTDANANFASNYSFEIRHLASGEKLIQAGQLFDLKLNTVGYRWNDGIRNEDDQYPRDWRSVISSQPIFEKATELDDLRTKLDLWVNSDSDFVATISKGELYVDEGRFEFFMRSEDHVRVTLDGQRLLDNWHGTTSRNGLAYVNLSRGKHSILIEHYDSLRPSAIDLAIRPVSVSTHSP